MREEYSSGVRNVLCVEVGPAQVRSLVRGVQHGTGPGPGPGGGAGPHTREGTDWSCIQCTVIWCSYPSYCRV